MCLWHDAHAACCGACRVAGGSNTAVVFLRARLRRLASASSSTSTATRPRAPRATYHIDPPGFALENFDPIGGWREFYRASTRTKRGIVSLPATPAGRSIAGPTSSKGGETPDGRTFERHRRLQEAAARRQGPTGPQPDRKAADLRDRRRHPVRRPRSRRADRGDAARQELRLPDAGPRSRAEPGVLEQVAT